MQDRQARRGNGRDSYTLFYHYIMSNKVYHKAILLHLDQVHEYRKRNCVV